MRRKAKVYVLAEWRPLIEERRMLRAIAEAEDACYSYLQLAGAMSPLEAARMLDDAAPLAEDDLPPSAA